MGFIAVKKHHDHGDYYKEKCLIRTSLPFQRFSPLSSLWEVWQQAGRHMLEWLKVHLNSKTARKGLFAKLPGEKGLFHPLWSLNIGTHSPPAQ